MILVSDIQARVAHEYGVDTEAMREPDGCQGQRRPERVAARQVAMLLSLRLTNHGAPKIGQLFGNRDHSTVYYACRKVEKRSRSDPALHNALRRLTFELLAS